MNALLSEYIKIKNYYMLLSDTYKKENDTLILKCKNIEKEKGLLSFENMCLKGLLTSATILIGYLVCINKFSKTE